MKFRVNTKPVVSGLDLAIINSNITKFFQKSVIVQLTVDNGSLRVNTEASSIRSELVFSGEATGEGANMVFVDSLLFKNLMGTISSDVIELEFKEDGLTVYSGKSHFNLPNVVSGTDLQLIRPQEITNTEAGIDVNSENWEFIKDQQLYAIAMSFTHPVYRNVWLDGEGNVLVGDFDNSIFTHSQKSCLDDTCLLTDTIVNLLTTVPEDSKIIKVGDNYEIFVEKDSFTYLCEFIPKYESEDVGDYSAPMILDLFDHSDSSIMLDLTKISTYIKQAELFATTTDATITMKTEGEILKLKNKNVDCEVSIVNPFEDFTIDFKISFLKDALSHMDKDEIHIAPLVQEDEGVIGLIMWTDSMSTVISGV